MFDYLSGTVYSVSQNSCVLDLNGVGFHLIASTKTCAMLSGKKEAKLYTVLNLGTADRASLDLYGFSSPREREFFNLLIGISGIGPKAAISILSALSPEELTMCVLSGDAKSICVAQGIGMKGAQKIILELKDKIAKTTVNELRVPTPVPQGGDTAEAVNALVVLGYAPNVAAAAVKNVMSEAMSLQDLIRLALKSIGDKNQ